MGAIGRVKLLAIATSRLSTMSAQRDRKTAACALDSPCKELQVAPTGMAYTCVVRAMQRARKG